MVAMVAAMLKLRGIETMAAAAAPPRLEAREHRVAGEAAATTATARIDMVAIGNENCEQCELGECGREGLENARECEEECEREGFALG